MEWQDHVDELLFAGEREQERLVLESATVVVTTTRVLAFTGAIDGGDYRAIDRPNVRGVRVEPDASSRSAGRALAAGAVGVGLVGASLLVDAGSVVDSLDAGDGPAGDVVDDMLAAVETLLSVFEFALLASGLVALGVGAFGVVRYGRSRSRELVLTVAGDENLVLPVADADLEAGVVPALEAAIGPASTSTSNSMSISTGGVDSDSDSDSDSASAQTAEQDGSIDVSSGDTGDGDGTDSDS